MPVEPARVISADPPWPAKRNKLPGDRSAAAQYNILSFKDIEDFELPELADNAILFMWRVWWAPEEALRVIRAWGFVPKSEIVWQKLTVKGNKHFGMGHYVRGSHETAIIAVKGKPLSRRTLDDGKQATQRSTFEAKMPVDDEGKRIHSAKPEEFYDIVEHLYDGPYVELFARRQRPGWCCLGDQVNGRQSKGANRGTTSANEGVRWLRGTTGFQQGQFHTQRDQQDSQTDQAHALSFSSRSHHRSVRQGIGRGLVCGLLNGKK